MADSEHHNPYGMPLSDYPEAIESLSERAKEYAYAGSSAGNVFALLGLTLAVEYVAESIRARE